MKEFGAGLIEASSGFIIAALGGDGIETFEGDSGLEGLFGLGE